MQADGIYQTNPLTLVGTQQQAASQLFALALPGNCNNPAARLPATTCQSSIPSAAPCVIDTTDGYNFRPHEANLYSVCYNPGATSPGASSNWVAGEMPRSCALIEASVS